MKCQIVMAQTASFMVFLLAASLSMAQDNKPIKISKSQIAGGIFDDHETVVEQHNSGKGEYTTHDVEAFLSSDKKFDMGIYRSGPVRESIDEPYGVNEYMHVIEGQIRLISDDGTKLDINPGDAVSVPREWTGVFESDGYLKIYVIYSPDGPIE